LSNAPDEKQEGKTAEMFCADCDWYCVGDLLADVLKQERKKEHIRNVKTCGSSSNIWTLH